MGIESDQVVFEYLSLVGDLAQQRQLPSATRMRLVTELRNEIDRRRAKVPVDSPVAVRRILARIGTPDEVVAAAATPGDVPAGEEPHTAVPVQRARDAEDRPKGLRRVVPRPRPTRPKPERPLGDGPSPPHLAGIDELGGSAVRPDWWRGDGNPLARPQGGLDGSNFDLGDSVPGFVGGVEIPELLKRPPQKPDQEERAEQGDQAGEAGRKGAAPTLEKKLEEEDADADADADKAVPQAFGGRSRRLVLPRLCPGGGWINPLLLLAAALLVAGAVVGSLVPLALGWLLAYLSRRLTRNEAKWAVLGVPGTVAAAGIVWLWGRMEGRWGDPVAEGQMSDALAGTWPWVLRGAAVASALYLVWRSQRLR